MTATTSTSGSTGWETILLPFNDFVRTNHGFVVEPQTSLLRQRVKSVGIGLTDRVERPYDLRIHRIWATNGMSEGEVDEERQICGTNALPVDEDVESGWSAHGSGRYKDDKDSVDGLRKEQSRDSGEKPKGLRGLQSEWDN